MRHDFVCLLLFVVAACIALAVLTGELAYLGGAGVLSAVVAGDYYMDPPSAASSAPVEGGKDRRGKPQQIRRERLPVVVGDSAMVATERESPDAQLRRRHHGQRKLFLSELAALTEVCNRYHQGNALAKMHILYVGSAPGHHIPTLMECFPNCTWDLRDPRQFWEVLTDDKRVQFTTGYFKDEHAEKLAKSKPAVDFIISDIRRNKVDMGENWENSIWDDMKMQRRWIEIIQPKYGSLIKMRLPWCGNPDQVCEEELASAKKLRYLDGMNMLQMFAGVNSHETRLLSFPPFTERDYDLEEIETRSDYFNRVWRERRNYDIRREYELWEDYLKLKTPEKFQKMSTNEVKGWFLSRMKAWMRNYSEWSKTIADTPEDV